MKKSPFLAASVHSKGMDRRHARRSSIDSLLLRMLTFIHSILAKVQECLYKPGGELVSKSTIDISLIKPITHCVECGKTAINKVDLYV